MLISILTLFPDMFAGPFEFSIVKRAIDKRLTTIQLVNLRDFATDHYKSVDDHPYGGGIGMILRVDVVDRALVHTIGKSTIERKHTLVILTDPRGKAWKQSLASKTIHYKHVIIVCGHYEGVDARIDSLVDSHISVGDFITTGGELPAMILVDSMVRLLPGVLKHKEATEEESFSDGLLEAPQYTRPQNYRGAKVPDVLLSGDHQKIASWKKEMSHKLTKKLRPDLG